MRIVHQNSPEPHSPEPQAPYLRAVPLAPKSGEDVELEVLGLAAPFIEPGTYDAVGGKAKVVRMFKATKLVVPWGITLYDRETEKDQTITVPRYYNIKPTDQARRVRAGTHSDYLRDWVMVAGRRPTRRDRLSPRIFDGVLCKVEVRTVKSDSRQRALPEPAQYSVVARLIERKAGGGMP